MQNKPNPRLNADSKQAKQIERQRKNKAITRSNKAPYYGYCIDSIQLG